MILRKGGVQPPDNTLAQHFYIMNFHRHGNLKPLHYKQNNCQYVGTDIAEFMLRHL